jgi:hypothetical protein
MFIDPNLIVYSQAHLWATEEKAGALPYGWANAPAVSHIVSKNKRRALYPMRGLNTTRILVPIPPVFIPVLESFAVVTAVQLAVTQL